MKVKKILIATACLVVIVAAAFLITRKSDADRVVELLERADQFEEQGDYDSAIIILRNALRLMPSHGAIHVRLAHDYAQIDQSHVVFRRHQPHHVVVKCRYSGLSPALASFSALA